MQSADKLVMMANQIARNLAVQGEERAIAATADHIRRFWDPRMRAKVTERLARDEAAFDPLARKALAALENR